jgi:hypothetical protein
MQSRRNKSLIIHLLFCSYAFAGTEHIQMLLLNNNPIKEMMKRLSALFIKACVRARGGSNK